MDLDLETFLTTLYVMVDDLYQTHVRPQLPACGGPPPDLSDSEVLCLGLAAQWRSGVPWKSERGFLRYAHKHLRPLFPGLTTQSAFNRRLRRLWGAFLLLQDAVAQERWLAELLLSARAGCPQLLGPHDPQTGAPELPVPQDWVGPVQSCGKR